MYVLIVYNTFIITISPGASGCKPPPWGLIAICFYRNLIRCLDHRQFLQSLLWYVFVPRVEKIWYLIKIPKKPKCHINKWYHFWGFNLICRTLFLKIVLTRSNKSKIHIYKKKGKKNLNSFSPNYARIWDILYNYR